MYPTKKNLGALGDGGIICTTNLKEYNKIKSLSEYGWVNRICKDSRGVNSRLDEIQASSLNLVNLNCLIKISVNDNILQKCTSN